MKILFVTATNTNVGKTYTTVKLVEEFSKQGIMVGVCKPIETGVTSEPMDAKLLLESVQRFNPNFHDLTPKDITAYTFPLPASPYSADLNRVIKIESIIEKIEELEALCDLLIVEGAGGLMVPITSSYKMIDLAEELKATTLLVTPSRLGCINDTLLSIEALKSREISFDWCVNLHEDRESFTEVTQPFYDEFFSDWWSVEDGLERFVERLR